MKCYLWRADIATLLLVPDLAIPLAQVRLSTMGELFGKVSMGWRVAPAFGLILLSGLAGRAQAAGLWRCIGRDGETVFSSSRSGYNSCRRIYDAGVQTLGGSNAAVSTSSMESGALREEHSLHRFSARQAQHETPQRYAQRRDVVWRGTVYKVTLAGGAVEYTNVRPVGIQTRKVDALFTYLSACYACNANSEIDWHTVPLRLHAFAAAIDAASARFDLDPALLRAVIHAESAFNPYAVSDRGARGLMQLMPDTASEMGVRDVFDPTQNIEGGARYLAQMMRDFGGDVTLATAAYNAGPAAVRKYDDHVPPYDETQLYVKRVRILKRRYAAAERANTLAHNG